MGKSGMFRFLPCAESPIAEKNDPRKNFGTSSDRTPEVMKSGGNCIETNKTTERHDVHVHFAAPLVADGHLMESGRDLQVIDSNQKEPEWPIGNNTPEQKEKASEVDLLREEVRARRVALRKLHARLKIDLNGMQKMKDLLETADRVDSSNVPQVITANGQPYSHSDFLQDFRQLFETSTAEIKEKTNDLENFTKKHTDMVETLLQSRRDKDPSSQLEGESQRLINDSAKLLAMLQKAMKIASVEVRLKVVFSAASKSTECDISKLESALLDLQRLKSTCGLDFNLEDSSGNLSSSYNSARDVFTQLFPADRILKLEIESKIKLAEFHINALANRQKVGEVRRQLQDDSIYHGEDKLQNAKEESNEVRMEQRDDIPKQVKSLVPSQPGEPQKCKSVAYESSDSDFTSKKQIVSHHNTESAQQHSPSASPVIQKKIKMETGKDDKLKQLLSDLQQSTKRKELDQVQRLLVDITSVKVFPSDKIVDNAYKMLIRLKVLDEKESNKDATEAIRAGLLSSIESTNKNVLADFLVRAQLIGLKNCIELMGAKAKLAQLQKNNVQYHSEMKKIEDYLDKLSTKAADNKATVDLIMSLERAIAVANGLDISSSIKHRANGALHVLNTRKLKVKKVKDELQRAVMECRHEAITCAITEAESLPYFLEFDPFDGQIAAILDYAKHKLSPHGNPTEAGQQNPAERRVKSNLKRAMKGSSSSKLESAISLFRKTYNISDGTANNMKRAHHTDNEDTKTLVRRAERKFRRMKKQEKLEKKAFISIRNNLRQSLKSAMNDKDRAELWKAVYQFKRELGSNLDSDDDKLLSDAKNQLLIVTVEQCKENLTSALNDRDATRLRHALVELDSPALSDYTINEDQQFNDDVEKAKKLLDHLSEMERLKKAVSEMNRSQLAELHRYPNPPSCVRAVMTATYVLLGENEKDLKDWPSVLRLLVKMGRESLIRRVAICTPSNIPASSAYMAQSMLSVLSPSQVEDVNTTAAIYYGWAKCVIAEVLDRHQHDPAREEQFKRRYSSKPKPKESPKDPIKSEFWNRLSRPRSSTTSRPVRRNPPRPISAAT